MRFAAEIAKLPRIRLYAVMVGVAITSAIASAALTILFLRMLNEALYSKAPFQSLGLGAGLLLGATSTSYLAQILMFKVGYDLVHKIRMLVVDHVADARLETLERFGLDGVITALTWDVRALVSFFAFVPNAIISSFILVGAVAYLLYLSPLIGVGAALGVGLLAWTGAVRTRRAAALGAANARDDQAVRQSIGQLVQGAREIRLNSKRRAKLVDRDLLTLSQTVMRRSVRISVGFAAGGELVRLAWFGFLLFTLGYAALTPRFGLAGAGAVMVVLVFVQQPITLISYGWTRLMPFLVGLGRLGALTETFGAGREAPVPPEPSPAPRWSEITLSQASFQYQGDGGFQIGPIDLTLKKGELIFITGLNGAGKTTFSKALSGLYPLTQGDILVDGKAVGPDDLNAYRQLFAIVFADKFLFDELVPADGAPIDDARDLVRTMRLEHKVALKDDWRFSTLNLSIGQRDRLAMINLLVQRRDIVISDEWPANQDPAFRRRFYEEILPTLKRDQATAIVISHDDRYYHHADRLWRLEDGRLNVH